MTSAPLSAVNTQISSRRVQTKPSRVAFQRLYIDMQERLKDITGNDSFCGLSPNSIITELSDRPSADSDSLIPSRLHCSHNGCFIFIFAF